VGSLPGLRGVCDADGYCRSPECEKPRLDVCQRIAWLLRGREFFDAVGPFA